MSTVTRMDATVSRTAFPTGYTVRDVARLSGLSQQQIHALVRSECVLPRRGENKEFRFSFQDLVLLRTAKSLGERLPNRKVYKAIRQLRDQLPSGRAVTGVRLTAEGDSVVVRDGDVAWEPGSGQALLDFDVSELAAKVEPLARETAAAAEHAASDLDVDEWYQVGCEMEPFDTDEARRAYAAALEADPSHADARLNLGRLLHEAGDFTSAETHYRRVLDFDAENPTAWYNLGVVLEDLKKPIEALDAYDKVLECDPTYADAHYNLSHLWEVLGDKQSALRHLQIYRRMEG